MTEKRNITKDDIYLEARIRSEGVRIETKSKLNLVNAYIGVVMDGCELVVGLWSNPYSRLEVIIDGGDVTISDMGEVLGTGTLEVKPPWRDKPLSDGKTTVHKAIPMWNADIASIILHPNCQLHDAGKTCKYCFMNAFPKGPTMPRSALEAWIARAVAEPLAAL